MFTTLSLWLWKRSLGRLPAFTLLMLGFLVLACSNGKDMGPGTGTNPTPTPLPAVTAFVAVAGDAQVALSWTNPSHASFTGARVLRKVGSHPANASDGILVYDGTAQGHVDSGLSNGIHYFYAAFSHDNTPTFASAALADATPLASPPVNPAIHYAAPNGTAPWAQSIDINTPCNGRTAVENAVAGDLVYFRGGTYNPAANPVPSWSNASDAFKYEQLPWNPSQSGTPTQPITFKAYPGETPVFLDNIYGGTIGAVGRDWIVWDGFTGTIVDSPNNVIVFAYFQDASNCVFRNGNLTGVLKNTHQNSALIFLLYTSNILIENNRLHDMNDDAVAGGEEAVNAAAILSFNSRELTIRNNDIYNNYIGIWDKDTEQNNRYYQNHIWGGSTPTTRCRAGIQIREALSRYGTADNPQAYQNVIRNCNVGVFSSYDNTTINNPKIYNNVIYFDGSLAGSDAGITISAQSNQAEVYNNIISGYSIPLRYFGPTASTVAYSNHNNFFHSSAMSWHIGYSSIYSSLSTWTSITTFDSNSILTNPLFVNAGGTTPSDYMLTANSPALGTGRSGVNMGAYPTTNSSKIGSGL